MRKVITENGHMVLEVAEEELPLLETENKDCEKCGLEDIKKIYYLPLLHKIFCLKCFEKWGDAAVYYPEDSLYEKSEFGRLGI